MNAPDIQRFVDSFTQNGFAVASGLFPEEELQLIESEVQRYIDREIPAARAGDIIFESNAEKSVRCVFRMHERSKYFAALTGDARLIALVQRLLHGAKATADGVMLISKAPHVSYEFPFHQDNAYQFWTPPDALAVTLALDDSSLESGAIVCLAGSHNLGVLPHRPSGVLGASRALSEMPDTVRYPELALSLRRGDVGFHHVNTIHRTGPNRTSLHRRNLGFAYHSANASRDEKAVARYENDLKSFLQSALPPRT
jgi:ectoine hydroxylase-related dioxygenase (phytanoyl-CoA dioxygenase family)